MTPKEKIQLYIKHIELFLTTYSTHKKFEPLKKFSKVYLHGFENASEIRDKVVRSHTPEEMLDILKA
jgi:tRNA-dihydrouridine synthase